MQGLFQKSNTKKIHIEDTKWTLSGLDPTDLRLPPGLPLESVGFGTFAEKSVSSSETSNSGALK